MPEVTFAPVTPANWSDLESLFERRGGPRHCYCMVNREMEPKYSRADSPAKRTAYHTDFTQTTGRRSPPL